MDYSRQWAQAMTLVALLLTGSVLQAQDAQCLDCHTASADTAVHAIFNTPHGAIDGGGSEACTGCHGPSEDHIKAPTGVSPGISFGPRWQSSAQERNASCQTCHSNGQQILWAGSAHEQEDLSCDGCHNSHQQRDKALDAERSQAQCLTCHPRIRSEIRLPSRHPIAEGKTACTDCHNPHGGAGEAELHQVTVNDNCFSCHSEKRGPFLWEHPPAAEDCSLCHRSHGSVNAHLLTDRGPAQCQQCHAAAFHPSVAYGAQGLANGSPNQNLLGKNCLNCHSQIHGSNHPSGARLTR